VVVWTKATQRALLSGEPARHALVLDLDMTATNTDTHMQDNVLPMLERSAARLRLPADWFHQTTRDFGERVDFHGIEFLFVEIALRLGMAWPMSPEQTIQLLIEPFQRRCVELEQRIQPLPGVIDGMGEINRRWPTAAVIVQTNCPTWLALLRAYHAGILPFLSGIIGINPYPPDISHGHPFWPCLAHCLEWLDEVHGSVPQDQLGLVASVPWWEAKPHSVLGLELALDWANPVGEVPVVSCGDNPLSEGRVAELLNAKRVGGRPIRYVRARYGAPDACPGDVPVHSTIDSFQELLPVLEGVWS
jgi:hypothetical protein